MSAEHAERPERWERPLTGARRRRASRWAGQLVWLCIFASAGCHTDPDERIVRALMGALTASKALQAGRDRLGRHFSHYINRRIKWLVGENASWGGAPDTVTLRIKNEIDALATYLDQKLGQPDGPPGPLGGPTDPSATPHVDLADVAKIYDDDDAAAIAVRQDDFVRRRRLTVEAIVWRAAALHHELWTSDDAGTAATFNPTAVDELLDRRLRAVERLLYTDDSAPDRGQASWTLTSATSGWRDHARIVMFEYPFIGLDPAGGDPFTTAAAAAGISLDAIPGFRHLPAELRYSVFAGRIRPPAAANWKVAPDGYSWDFVAGSDQPSAALDKLIPSTSPVDSSFGDFWNRNWVFCDHMLCVIHLDALRFGLRRRNSNSDTEFDGLGDMHLTPLLGDTAASSPNGLIASGKTYFVGDTFHPGDLEVGDHIIFWNNYLFRSIFATDFGLENSLITDVDGELAHSSFVGHGESNKSYGDFADAMLGALKARFKFFRDQIIANGGVDQVLSSQRYKYQLIPWSPYGEIFHAADAAQLQVSSAWWVRIRLEDTGASGKPPLKLAEALLAFPNSVAINTAKQTPPEVDIPDHASDWRESIYLPLSVPNGRRGGWPAYFQAREAGQITSHDVALDDVKVDGSWAPGLYFHGPGTKVPVIRPKVRP